MPSNTFSKCVLIIEDDVDLSSIYKSVFQKTGYNAISFTDPILAFEHFKSNPNFYKLIFTDLRMPGMSGIDLAKKIRCIRNDIVIWLCTAFMVEDFLSDDNFKSARFDMVLEKPIKLSQLKQIIETKLTPLQLK
jgi:DNA-binding NtrC family response regulator